MRAETGHGKVVALCGGVGGAKLVLGLDRILPAGDLTVIINTGDDFEHLGFRISPDIDTVTYTLAGLANSDTGWGRRDETWSFMETLAALGGETWFQLGDRDLALHAERTRRLREGETLTEVTQDFCEKLGITSYLLPMSDDAVATVVETENGPLPFQKYFVAEKAAPAVRSIRYECADQARTTPAVRKALADPDLACVIIAPSNPYLSIDPLLAIGELKQAVQACHAPVLAVSPIVGGAAVKGPTAKIMRELAIPVTPAAIARHYDGLIDGFILDRRDADVADEISMPVGVEDTLMTTLERKTELARSILDFASKIGAERTARGAA